MSYIHHLGFPLHLCQSDFKTCHPTQYLLFIQITLKLTMRWFRASWCTTTSRWITSLTISSIRSGFSTQSSLTGSLLFTTTTSTTMRCGLSSRRSCWAVIQSRPIISTAQLSLVPSIIYQQCHKKTCTFMNIKQHSCTRCHHLQPSQAKMIQQVKNFGNGCWLLQYTVLQTIHALWDTPIH